MGRRRRKGRLREALRHTLLVLLLMGPGVFLVVWLMFQHKPGWYRPVVVSEALLRRARVDTAEMLDSVSHKIVQGRTFEVTLIETMVNEWLGSLRHLWPNAQRSITSDVSEIAVRFEIDRIHIGAHVVRGGWQVIGNAGFRLNVTEDGASLRIGMVSAHAGSLPMPRAVLDRILDMVRSSGLARREGLSIVGDLESVDELFDPGVMIRNRFIWPNGHRPFRIDSIEMDDGELRLRIEPL